MATDQSDYYLDKLRKVLVFRYLQDDALKEILKISDVINYKKNDRIISEGELSQYLYAVLEGSVNVYVKQEGEKEVFLSTLDAGDVFGEAGMFLKVKRTANVVSVDNSSVLRISRDDLFDFFTQRSQSGIKMLLIIIYSLLKRLRESAQELAFERKSNLLQEDVDQLIGDFIRK
jgi:CRP/FNR family cyclic AMP-dependent transcriptional regulator